MVGLKHTLTAASLALLLAGTAHAGCGEGRGTCYYYKSGELKSQGACAVTTCAATDQYFFTHWNWDSGNEVRIDWDTKAQQLLVNGKPGYSLVLPYKDDKMICYAVAASDELACNDSGNY
jgi:hypothetical protein